MNATERPRILLLFAAIAVLAAPPCTAFAGHPLGTEDPGVLGKGNAEIELNFERAHLSGDVRETIVGTTLTYGITPRLNAAVAFSYLFVKDPGAAPSSDRGMGDTEVTLKGVLLEQKGIRPTLGLKAGVKLPTADHEKGFGTGAVDGLVTAIAGWEAGPLSVFANTGYTVAGRSLIDRSRDDAFTAGLALEYRVREKLSGVAEYVWEKNVGAGERAGQELLFGGKYEVARNIILDGGVKWGLAGTAPNATCLAGVTVSLPGSPASKAPPEASK